MTRDNKRRARVTCLPALRLVAAGSYVSSSSTWSGSASTTAYPSTKPASAPAWSDWNRTTRTEKLLVNVSAGGSSPQIGGDKGTSVSPSNSWTLSAEQFADATIDTRWMSTSNIFQRSPTRCIFQRSLVIIGRNTNFTRLHVRPSVSRKAS